MKQLSNKEKLEEMSKYGFTEEKIKEWYEDTEKEVSFEEYVKYFYESDVYMNA